MPLNPDAVGTETEPAEARWTSKDSLLYALGVGAGASDPPGSSSSSRPRTPTASRSGRCRRCRWSSRRRVVAAAIRAGRRPSTTRCSSTVSSRSRCTSPFPSRARRDQGPHRRDVRQGQGRGGGARERGRRPERGPLWTNTMSAFIRGEGGWGGDRGPSGPRNVPPERDPDHVVSYTTRTDQALLYRLNGDRNPLHSDPKFAAAPGSRSRSCTGSARTGSPVVHCCTRCAAATRRGSRRSRAGSQTP